MSEDYLDGNININYFEENLTKEYSLALRSCVELDPICSNHYWIFADYYTIKTLFNSSQKELSIFRLQSGYCLFSKNYHPNTGIFYESLAINWIASAPIVPIENVKDFIKEFKYFFEKKLTSPCIINGIDPYGKIFHEIQNELCKSSTLRLGNSDRIYTTDISFGIDYFLSNRSKKFSKKLIQYENKAKKNDIYFFIEDKFSSVDQIKKYIERCRNIELSSWKGKSSYGLCDEYSYTFYTNLLNQAYKSKVDIVFIFALFENKDIGFIFGIAENSRYRGLQVSYHDDFSKFSIGNLLQFNMIKYLSDKGISTYDLGAEIPYKTNWADHKTERLQLIILPK